MFQDTRPAPLDADGGPNPWAEFRVDHPQERLRLLRELRDGGVPVILNGPGGASFSTTLWAIDDAQGRLSFNADALAPALASMVDANEAVAVAYLESVKLQFDLQGLVLLRTAHASVLQCRMPQEIYRFQRRGAYRVRTAGRGEPVARLRHPAIPEMQLTLRVLDLSIGGCALWLPADVPPLQPGTRLGEVRVDLDADTRFSAAAVLQHAASPGENHPERGMRMGCQWSPLAGQAERVLQRWIDQAQKRRRLLSLR
ncbi:Flagellar brake protein YcgR [Rubrivivax sp. A210]|uniref:flagellar brake protein n=1 Tax=Rubrivivax sp. A210 TaxID=2772301 RepID=UPI00191AC507|nr:flagellar brake protein [Rubrivivax sp. A210]CAD5373627.1 Flagellar brake protein YcgR [Rubrivivax sp. A210]